MEPDEIKRLMGDDDERDAAITFHGPFVHEFYRLSVGGYEVPYIRAMLVAGTEDTWTLLLDNRFATEEVSGDEVRRWLWFLGNAMAVAAGYSCHGANQRRINPFDVQIHGITLDGDEEA